MKRLTLVAATLVAAGCASTTPQQKTTQNDRPERQADFDARQADFVGARGPAGPTGATGPQGPTGQTGAPGYAAAGPRGPEGPTGATGEQGRTGARGSAGDMAVGPAGVAGPSGDTGAQGLAGQTGARGASAEGYAGPAGPAGPTGAPGPTGDTGAKGATLVGPAGPAGPAGPTGERGGAGQTGAQGADTAGIAGATGASGPSGPQGITGPTGPQGPVGAIARWTNYREFWFNTGTDDIDPADAGKVTDIAAYLRQNPSLHVGIDSSTDANRADQRGLDLAARRGSAVRSALIAAGVPASSIRSGTFGDSRLARDGRVGVLIQTNPLAQTPLDSAGSTGVAQRWVSYRDFSFDPNKAVIHDADSKKVAEIAAYMSANPSLRLGLDGSTNPRATDSRDLDLRDRRVGAVRSALIAAGVPAASITSGAFGDSSLARDGRVEVLMQTNPLAQAPLGSADPAGVFASWRSYCEFWFDTDSSSIHSADTSKVAEIATYLQQNPSSRVGIDGSMNPNVVDQSDLTMATRRGNTVRDALIAAGVPASSITSGTFGDSRLRRDGRVEVLIKSGQRAERP